MDDPLHSRAALHTALLICPAVFWKWRLGWRFVTGTLRPNLPEDILLGYIKAIHALKEELFFNNTLIAVENICWIVYHPPYYIFRAWLCAI